MKALGLLWVGTLLPLTATTISVTLGGNSCDPAGACTSNPRATTITFDPLLSWTTSPYVTGDVTYTWSGLNTPFVQDSVDGNYASPPGDTTPYLTIGSPYRPASVTIDFSKPIYYFGFYMGSPDDYNVISFYGGPNRSLIESIYGNQLISPGGGSWDLGAFVNFYIYGGSVSRIVMSSETPAFETDSHAYDELPEPGTWAMFGVGLGLVVAARTRWKRS
jgi:hypothetical protein